MKLDVNCPICKQVIATISPDDCPMLFECQNCGEIHTVRSTHRVKNMWGFYAQLANGRIWGQCWEMPS